jgi:hypothetical protein
MRLERFSFGSIRIDDVTYGQDVVIDRGKTRKRRKKPSKPFRDIIGFGRSSKPSDGLRAHFPHYRLHDVAVAQHRLITEGLNIPHLKLVMGLSLGGMLTWMFGEMFPDFMDALVPVMKDASQP